MVECIVGVDLSGIGSAAKMGASLGTKGVVEIVMVSTATNAVSRMNSDLTQMFVKDMGGSDEAAMVAGIIAGYTTGYASDKIMGNAFYNKVTEVNGINGGVIDDVGESGKWAADDIIESSSDIKELSNSNIQHVKKHTFDGMAEQAKYLSDEQLSSKLNNTSFFNKDWSQDEIIEYTQEAYNTLRSQGKTGLQSVKINGETINVFIKDDGTFDTAYGIYKYTVDDFR